ncbi:MAG: NAD(P)/FAD-dependent oxidoreductase [Parachlamydiaceae bacterium]
MKIAIIGSGLAGSSLATLLNEHEVDVFTDLKASASSIAAGMLHKFVGLENKKNPLADSAYDESVRFIKKHAPEHIHETTIVRLALNETQVEKWEKAARLYPELKWVSDASKMGPYPSYPALLVPGAIVDCPEYLKKLHSNLNIIVRRIETIEELSNYDQVVIASGPMRFKEQNEIKTHLLKGQLLEFPFSLDLPSPINSSAYFIKKGSMAILGATFERSFESAEPDFKTAYKELNPYFETFFPSIKMGEAKVKSGLRVTTPDRLPIAKRLNERLLILNGFGSRGLLYHVYFSNMLVKNFLKS